MNGKSSTMTGCEGYARHEKMLRLCRAWQSCSRCPLASWRTMTVMGRGSIDSGFLMIGEAPGAEEDKTGLSFVGPAGQKVLDPAACSLGIDLDHDAYIANLVACRPPRNRVPLYNEIEQCRPRLDALVAIMRPRAILVLGGTALTVLMGQHGIGKARGKWVKTDWNWKGETWSVPTLATFHPAGLLPGRLRDDAETGVDKDRFLADLALAYQAVKSPNMEACKAV